MCLLQKERVKWIEQKYNFLCLFNIDIFSYKIILKFFCPKNNVSPYYSNITTTFNGE